MRKKYLTPLTEVIALKNENIMVIESQSPFVDAREGFFVDESDTSEDEPIFDRWKNSTWEE